ncbi:MAG: restriction endonuclease [Chloroflexota bacterium]|nr:restriction endonuclease [Chloroflexota bacterium]MDE2960286.1 restriction endonuclease [Chloroflexota bacterium]
MTTPHEFTDQITGILREEFQSNADSVFERSQMLQYLNIKTRSASRGSKARGSFANHYALYVLVEDYINKGYHQKPGYASYEGARYTDLFTRQRELPFGEKLQNHALNSRLNEEFRKYFPTCEFVPILRDNDTNRYWINENLLIVEADSKKYNIAGPVIAIIDAYVDAKRDSFERFITQCERLRDIQEESPEKVREFISSLVQPDVDARIFEIVSYAILKCYYGDWTVFWGWDPDEVNPETIALYKTGRTNANDGGIDFVMRPLGRFFQVTESTDVRKYFLDIDKVQRFPITFVVKSGETVDNLTATIRAQATRMYNVETIVNRYMECIEELINIPILLERFEEVMKMGKVNEMVHELVIQSKVEFNLPVE